MQLVFNALLGLHAFSDCDTISAFPGKGKVKPLNLTMKNEKYISTFEEAEISTGNFDAVEGFVLAIKRIPPTRVVRSFTHRRMVVYKQNPSHLAQTA